MLAFALVLVKALPRALLGVFSVGKTIPVAHFWRDHYAEQDRNPGARCC